MKQRAMKHWIHLLAAAAALACCSCNRGGTANAPGGAAGGASPEAIKRRTVDEFPEVGDYAPPIDDGRLEAAPPVEWRRLPRGRTYLMAFAPENGGELPRITINAENSPADGPSELTEENVHAFAARQDAERAAGNKLVEEPGLPIYLGETLYVRHVRRARSAGSNVVVQSLETIKNGRLYTVELIAEIDAARAEEYEESLKTWRNHGYAVAAHLRFAQEGEAFSTLADLDAEKKQDAETPAADSEEPKPQEP